MKTNKKIISLVLGSVFLTSAFAQTPKASNTTTAPSTVINTLSAADTNAAPSNSSVGVATLAATNAQLPSAGNTYERETTPLLRRIAQKKAELMEEKLNSELEKTKAERLKTQQERNNGANSSNAANNGGKAIDVSNLSNSPLPTQPTVVQAPVEKKKKSKMKTDEELLAAASADSDVRVLMTYGFDDNLYAKVTSGTQGGYVVTKGDILPDGRMVVKVRSNYIEVALPNKVTLTQKIYVSVTPPAAPNSPQTVNTNSSGSAGSTNIIPLMGPMSSAPIVSSSGNVQLPPSMKVKLPTNLPNGQ